MKKISSFLAVVLGATLSVAAHATSPTTSTTSSQTTAYPPSNTSNFATPDYINASFGAYDFDKDNGRTSVDYRLEYQWGLSLVPLLNHDWSSVDRWAQLHPVVGFEGDGNGMTYLHAGLGLDVPLGSKVIFTWDEAMGLYGHGDDRQSLGSPFEVRSQVELGWKFDNNMRLSGYFSHMSNVGAGDNNPGAETVGAYLRVPVGWLAH